MAADRVERALFLIRRWDAELTRLCECCRREAALEVETVSDGLQGLRLAKRMRPKLLLTEMILPGLDGLSICRALRREPATSSIRLMMVSILAAEERAREAGVDLFLRRPVEGERLVESALRLLGRRFVGGPEMGISL
ncbi:MAG TPA: hypothetical protein DFS52_27360 [Myxococcales bacterium]|jgi:CheY-like chemotaxis protein|nr:hypothetical protein [Myxococcales bacterium]